MIVKSVIPKRSLNRRDSTAPSIAIVHKSSADVDGYEEYANPTMSRKSALQHRERAQKEGPGKAMVSGMCNTYIRITSRQVQKSPNCWHKDISQPPAHRSERRISASSQKRYPPPFDNAVFVAHQSSRPFVSNLYRHMPGTGK